MFGLEIVVDELLDPAVVVEVQINVAIRLDEVVGIAASQQQPALALLQR